MTNLTTFITRNADFATNGFPGQQPITPSSSAMVLTCVDARVDPAHTLGLKVGESLVFRSGGARVTPDVMFQIGVLWTLTKRNQGDDFNGMSLMIMHHTDCGFERLTQPEVVDLLVDERDMDRNLINQRAIADHTETLLIDIEMLRQSPSVPNELVVSGHIYRIEDGLVHELVAPAPLGA